MVLTLLVALTLPGVPSLEAAAFPLAGLPSLGLAVPTCDSDPSWPPLVPSSSPPPLPESLGAAPPGSASWRTTCVSPVRWRSSAGTVMLRRYQRRVRAETTASSWCTASASFALIRSNSSTESLSSSGASSPRASGTPAPGDEHEGSDTCSTFNAPGDRGRFCCPGVARGRLWGGRVRSVGAGSGAVAGVGMGAMWGGTLRVVGMTTVGRGAAAARDACVL